MLNKSTFPAAASGLAAFSLLLLAAPSALLTAPPALAQGGDVLPPTVVIGRQIEEKMSAELAEYGHHLVVIQGEDILKQGYTDLTEAIAKMVPGLVFQTQSRADYGIFTINGTSNVLWLMDGVRLNNRLFGSWLARLDTIGIHLIDRIEVLMGGEGLFYGTESSSGVVNIITKKPTEEFSGEVGAAVGTKGYYNGWATVSGGAGRHRFLASASYDTWDGYYQFRPRVYQLMNNYEPVKRSYDRLNVTMKYETELYLAGRNAFSVNVTRNSGHFDMGNPANHRAVNDRAEYVGTVKWDHDVSPNYSYFIKAYYHSWWSDYDTERIDRTMSMDKAIWGYQDWGINILNSIRFDSGHELLVGYDYQNYWGKDDVMMIQSMHEQVHAVYAQFRPRFPFWEEWRLALGARYNWADAAKSFIWNVSSRMPLMGGDRLFLRANVGTSFILPNAQQLFIKRVTSTSQSYGNPNLKPQRSFSAVVGIGSSSERFDLDVGVFYERMTDRIITANNTYQNAPDTSQTRGFSVTAAARPVDGLTLSAYFVSQRFKLVDTSGRTIDKIERMPMEYLKLGLQYDGDLGGQKFGIGVYNTWMGRVYGNVSRLTQDPWQNYGNYWLTDVNLYYKPVESVRITLSLANIFNKEYTGYGLGYAADPQDPKGYMLYENPLSSPFTATLGVTYSF
ncbi:MAG: TonB-dependent receptor [Deltaproteobacteria bacterium]|jgi:vitamin B12 transporter|nr:TonB-dependent receptor [Deltaproteobacteria bacterium]